MTTNYSIGRKGQNVYRSSGAGETIRNFFGNHSIDSSDIGNWYRTHYETNNSYLDSLTNAQLGALINQDQFWKKQWGNIWGKNESLDLEKINKYLSQLQNYDKILGEMPTAPDYEAIQKEVYNAINSENQELLGMLEQDLARQ